MFHHKARQILANANVAAKPIGAIAITSATYILLGRQTASKTTTHVTSNVSNTARRNLHYFVTKNNGNTMNATVNFTGIRAQQYQFQRLLLHKNRNNCANNIPIRNKTTVATNPSTSSAPQKSKTFLEWYEGHLESKPVPTKMVTGAILWGLGDAVAQIVPALFFDDSDATSTANNANNSDTVKEVQSKAATVKEYDYPRTARAMIFGFVIHAPLSHVHFNFLEWMTIRGGFSGMRVPVFKAFMEQFVYWSWFSNSLYHGAMGAMQGMSPQQIYDRISDVLWDTQKAQWVFWIPVQLLNFQFVPVRHQLNVVLLTSVVWTALLSAWYPPGEDEKMEAIEAKPDREEEK